MIELVVALVLLLVFATGPLYGKKIVSDFSRLAIKTTVNPQIYLSEKHSMNLCDSTVLSSQLNLHSKARGAQEHNKSLEYCGLWKGEERGEFIAYVENADLLPVEQLLDVIFIFDQRNVSPSAQFSLWREAVQGFHVIILCIDEFVDMEIPPWLEASYEVFSFSDVRYAFRKKLPDGFTSMGEYDIMKASLRPGIGIRNFATWLSTKRYVYVVDNDAIGGHTCSPRHDILSQHLINVISPSLIPICYRSRSSNGLKLHAEHKRVYYNFAMHKIMKPTAISIGMKLNADTHSFAESGSSVITLPQTFLINVPLVNTMYNRKLMGAALFFVTPDKAVFGPDFEKYSNLISTWIMQKIAWTVNMGVKVGAPYLAMESASDLDTTVKGLPLFFENDSTPRWTFEDAAMQSFPQWIVDLRNFFMHFPLNLIPWDDGPINECDGGSDPWTTCLMLRLAQNISYSFGKQYPQLEALSVTMREWAHMYDARHQYFNNAFAFASRSSLHPFKKAKVSKAKCAMVTITHNEQVLLPIWIRYHMKHFDPEDIYIFDHLTDDGSTHSSQIPQGINFAKLEGNKHKMPVRFRSRTIKGIQERLLRDGYKCVVFSDVDEILIPNPLYYPGGLQNYLENFVSDDKRYIVAGTAWEVAHMSYGNGTDSTTEPKLRWNESILAQRRFVFIDPQYNKPLITKVPLTYSPGFHELQSDYFHRKPAVIVDPELIMFHLRSVDITFCLEREIQKHNMTKEMQQDELLEGMANHWSLYELAKSNGELCRFAIGCWLGEFIKNVTIAYDNTGKMPLMEIPPYWNLVDL